MTLRWYEAIGVHISEGWGMSETTGLACTNTPFKSDRIGTIGEPLPKTEMKLSDEGEILIRSPELTADDLIITTKLANATDGLLVQQITGSLSDLTEETRTANSNAPGIQR